MIPNGTEILWKLQNCPERLSDEELTRTTLRALSKALGVFTSYQTINVYLRWLEIQRKAPRRNINYHWTTTVGHWTQALRARGFSLEEINRELFAWKELNGPFVDASSPGSESRLLPTVTDLALIWSRATKTTTTTRKTIPQHDRSCETISDRMARRYDTQLEQKLDSALTKVPGSYICNRCKGRGHYVSDCPTNEDPAYDILAGFDYVCKFCKERGTHYFMFCPRNPDPNSIYKRRQDKIFQNRPGGSWCSDLGLMRTSPSAPESLTSPESPGPASSGLRPIIVPKASSSAPGFDLFAEGKTISPRDATFGFANDSRFYDTGRSMTRSTSGDARCKGPPKGDEQALPQVEMFGSPDGDMVWERLRNDLQRESSRGQQQWSNNFLAQLANERAADATAATISNQSPHANFLSKLFTAHPSRPNPKSRPRMTALEMWDMNDARKVQEEREEEMVNDNGCEPLPGLESPGYNQRSLNHHSTSSREHSIDVDEEYHLRATEEDIDFLISTKGFEENEKYQADQEWQENKPTREEKLRAIQKRINSIEEIRTKLASDADVDFPEMEQMASGKLSQEKLDEISRRMQSPEPASPSGLTSSSSELSSPPRFSNSGSKRGKGRFRTD